MEQRHSNHSDEIGQSRAELRCRLSGLLALARELDSGIALYHLDRAYTVLGLRRDRDVLFERESE